MVSGRAGRALGLRASTGAATANRCGATPGSSPRRRPSTPATIADAERFAAELCRALGLKRDSAIPAYEDAAHFALAEQKLPLGVAPEDNKLAEPAERERLIRVFDRGLDKPVGYVLPLLVTQRAKHKRRFITERWTFKRGHLFLIPGDSPLGLRLPLAGLPEISFEDYPHVLPADPFAAPKDMPGGPDLVDQHASGPALRAEKPELVRTALAVEARDGHVCVFLPPLADGEDYAALIAAIEAAATKTKQAIRLEGYAPPFDPRINVIKVTPDPGVIEVNVHPATSWDHAVDITTAVYEEAAKIGLGAEKFRLDGRHVGTGGGNHIVLGGMTPADSPFLRRPDLLASIIAYWQNHPSLSYMFAGQFVGPDQPGAARRRSPARVALRARDRAATNPRAGRRHPALAGRSSLPQPARGRRRATRTGPKSASTSSTRRKGPWAASASSSSAPSR